MDMPFLGQRIPCSQIVYWYKKFDAAVSCYWLRDKSSFKKNPVFLLVKRYGHPWKNGQRFSTPADESQILGCPFLEPCGGGGGDGEVSTKRAKLSTGASTGAGSEDRLSALPDDILVLILRCLSTCGATQTSVLSRRWRRVWALVPTLCFRYTPDTRQIGPALEAHETALLRLSVLTRDAAPDSVSAWLAVAARRLSGSLLFHNTVVREWGAQEGDEEEAAQKGAFELPCLERATEVSLHLGFLVLAVPPAGVFARLCELYLSSIRFHSPGLLGDAVSWPRCPCLQKLNVLDARGLDNLSIHTDSLRQVELTVLRGLRQLNIVAPALEELKVAHCYFYSRRSQPVANSTAPQLATLRWMDPYDPSSVHLGEMRHLRLLKPFFFVVYGDDSSTHNQSCLSLLRRFKVIEHLILTLIYLSDIDDYQYVMEDMTMLPNITILHLNIFANKHAFGTSAFHVLRMCSGIRKLMLAFLARTYVEAQTACPPGCICGEHQNWETEHLLLNHLKEVEITRMRGYEHEVTFVKQLLIWGTALEKVTVFFDESVTESVAKALSLVLRSFPRPEIKRADRRRLPHEWGLWKGKNEASFPRKICGEAALNP
ncbi:unnamed protein product [Miscanthus lutarioriparius]|uniref:F-box domain-containing protein n=1 Tax=Miscanthus lutarioriparius TaxID=422564 RepID=A0A811NRS0_9POAL|nr:unnamed protein product [Miscanthus lutarioriparius]